MADGQFVVGSQRVLASCAFAFAVGGESEDESAALGPDPIWEVNRADERDNEAWLHKKRPLHLSYRLGADASGG
jgi:hypothetical protein